MKRESKMKQAVKSASFAKNVHLNNIDCSSSSSIADEREYNLEDFNIPNGIVNKEIISTKISDKTSVAEKVFQEKKSNNDSKTCFIDKKGGIDDGKIIPISKNLNIESQVEIIEERSKPIGFNSENGESKNTLISLPENDITAATHKLKEAQTESYKSKEKHTTNTYLMSDETLFKTSENVNESENKLYKDPLPVLRNTEKDNKMNENAKYLESTEHVLNSSKELELKTTNSVTENPSAIKNNEGSSYVNTASPISLTSPVPGSYKVQTQQRDNFQLSKMQLNEVGLLQTFDK